MFCPNCGTKNDDTATTCTKCGFKLAGASAAKFRGTMLLNTDQSVQEMVEQHRRKLEQSGTEEPSAADPGNPPAAAGAGLPVPEPESPPQRAGAVKRRMGTMLGVAPQVGGVQPPAGAGAQTPPVPSAARPAEAAGAASLPDPLGGTVAFAAVPAAAPAAPAAPPAPPPPGAAAPVPPASDRSEAREPAPARASAAAPEMLTAAARTEALPPEPVPAASPLAAGRTQALGAVPETPPAPERGRKEAFAASPLPVEQPAPAAVRPSASDGLVAAGVPRRLQPLDVFLIVITFGLYALVLRARQRKAG